jgi:hypothetical protein
MSLHQVKVTRTEVLEIVKENKKKHDAILKDAIEGFWIDAEKHLKKTEKEQIAAWEKDHKDKLKLMRKNLRENKKKLKEQIRKELDLVSKKKKDGPWSYMNRPYPESHADDYIGTIRRLELCVEKEIELDTQEFDKYIRNKWDWRNSFLSSNSGYATSYRSSAYWGTGSCLSNAGYAVSGSWASCSLSSSYALTAPWAGNVGLGTSNPNSILHIHTTEDIDSF